MTLTAKQEAFCQAIASGMNQSDAYRASYDVRDTSKPEGLYVSASKLASNPKIANRIALLKQSAMESWLAKKAGEITDGFYEAKAKKCLVDVAVDSGGVSKPKKTTRYAVFLRAGFKCQCCGAKPTPTNDVVLHLDHVIPKSMGGIDDPINLQALCSDCNLSKTNAFAYDHNQEVDLWVS